MYLQWNFNQNTKFFIHKNALENILCDMATILSRGRCVDIEAEQAQLLYQQLLVPSHWIFVNAQTAGLKALVLDSLACTYFR